MRAISEVTPRDVDKIEKDGQASRLQSASSFKF